MLETCRDNSVTNILLMNKENCALKLVDEIILYYKARSNIKCKQYYIIFASFLFHLLLGDCIEFLQYNLTNIRLTVLYHSCVRMVAWS